MSQKVNIHGSLLVKNTALNFIGQALPLLVAVATVPFIIRRLGTERFGIFSIVWVILGYFSLFDFGLGRTTTKFVAEALGRGETERIPTIVWTSLTFISFLGLIGTIVLVALTPFLVEHILNIPANLIDEAILVCYIASASILITLAIANLRGVLEAYQRFDLVNVLRIPSSILSYIIPVSALLFNASLSVIIFLLVVKNLGMLIFYLFFCLRIMPSTDHFFSVNFKIAPSLFSFGGWISVHNIAASVLLSSERLLIGILLTMTAVTYYTAPYELVVRLVVVPSSMMMVLFPAFSTLQALGKERLKHLFLRSLKYLILIMGLIALIIAAFSKEILAMWLGSDFEKSAVVLRTLSIGIFLSSLAWLCGTVLQGIGRPKTVAIIAIAQVPLYLLMVWLLIGELGIEGAALAWTLQKGVSVFLLLTSCRRLKLLSTFYLIENGVLKSVVAISILVLLTFFTKALLDSSLLINTIIVSGVITIFALTAWFYVMDTEDRMVFLPVKNALRKFFNQNHKI